MSFIFLEDLTAETPPQGLEIGSPDLDKMRELADAGDYSGLLELALTLSEQKIFDIRVVFYGIYAEKRAEGLLGLIELFSFTINLLQDKWAGLGPDEKRDRYAKGSLSWLLSQVRVDLQTVELAADDNWKNWIQNFSIENLDELQKLLTELGHVIREVLSDENSGDPSSKITELSIWLSELAQKLPKPEVSEDESSSDKEEKVARSGYGNFGSGSVTGSVHLDILMKKLALFEQVMEQGDIAKAAVIVADITEIIEQFDPRLYLPSLFSRFFSLLTPRISEVFELMEMRDTPQFQALTSLYRVDMDAFLNLELNQ